MGSREFERIARIKARLGGATGDVRIGIGDDAAVLSASQGAQVLTVDTHVEGVHFRRAWLPMRALGRRAVVAAASDIAAMGARARAVLLSLVLPAGFDDAELDALIDGAGSAAHELGAPVVGGNLSRGGELSITTTVLGEATGRVLTRVGAQVSDSVYVTGTLGAAALGLRCLERDLRDADAEPFVARWRAPHAQLLVGGRLVELASACIDVSDGLAQDLEHLCVASGVSARVFAAEVPKDRGHDALAARLGEDGDALALAGGEDYELLFTAPASLEVKHLATRIGEILPVQNHQARVELLGRDGKPVTLARAGWAHDG